MSRRDEVVEWWLAMSSRVRAGWWATVLGEAGSGCRFDRGVRIRHPSKVSLGAGVWLKEGVLIDGRSERPSGVMLADNVIIRAGTYIDAYGHEGFVEVGSRSGIGQFVYIGGNGGVEIGSDAMISGGCWLVAANHCTDPHSPVPYQDQGETRRGIRIDDGAWIAAGSVILDGVHVGRRAVVAAGSVVTSDVPDYWLVAGVPAARKRDLRMDPSGSRQGARIYQRDEPVWMRHLPSRLRPDQEGAGTNDQQP